MMTLTFGLLVVSSFFLWWRKAQWGWVAVLAALVLGLVVFSGDVDVSQNLGIRL